MNLNILRKDYKKTAEKNTSDIEQYLGDLLNKAWEVVRVSTLVIDKCLQIQSVIHSEKHIYLILMSRNLLSDCCCCLDSLERGHDRTIMNNLRMILEDLCCIIDATENENVYNALKKDKHQASKSITFATKHYSTHDLNLLYGMLSKISHHQQPGLIVRQWINRDGLMSHIKPYDPNRNKGQLNILLLLLHFSRLIGEVAEKPHIDVLEAPYFWTKEKTRNEYPPINIVMTEVADKIKKEMERANSI